MIILKVWMAKNKQTASTNIGGLFYSFLQSVGHSVVLGIEPRASCLLGRHATRAACLSCLSGVCAASHLFQPICQGTQPDALANWPSHCPCLCITCIYFPSTCLGTCRKHVQFDWWPLLVLHCSSDCSQRGATFPPKKLSYCAIDWRRRLPGSSALKV